MRKRPPPRTVYHSVRVQHHSDWYGTNSGRRFSKCLFKKSTCIKKCPFFFLSVSTIMFRSKIIWCYNWYQKYPLLIVLQLSRTINLKYYLQLELIFRFKSTGDECQYKAQTFNWLVCICFLPLFPVTKITQCGHHESKDEKWYQCTENDD